jgi:hypothetical protein
MHRHLQIRKAANCSARDVYCGRGSTGSRATNAQLCASSFRCGPGQSENTWLYAICRFSVNENIKMLTLLIRRLKLSWLVILLVERRSDDINESMYLVDQEGRIDEQIKPWRWRRPKHMGWLHPKVNLHIIPACSEGDESGRIFQVLKDGNKQVRNPACATAFYHLTCF